MIQIKNLNFKYSRKRELFSNLNLDLQTNSIVGLLGKNGAGKTSLLKLVAGLRFPTSGVITVNGFKPANRNVAFLSELYFLSEEFDTPNCTILNYVKAKEQFYANFDSALLERLLSEFELDKNHKLNKLSYGQKKKFLISFALATKCQLLIFDEPTNGLDIPSKAIFRKILAGSLSENQLVIISTHQVKDVENLLDRLVVIDDAKIIFNAGMLEIADSYSFGTVSTISNDAYVYYEPSPHGYKVIQKQSNSETTIDIELLFNAIINRKIEI
jgi:ABC-2 type transport system ATP-binding protein